MTNRDFLFSLCDTIFHNLQLGQIKDEDVATDDPLDKGEGDAGFFEDE